MRINAFVAQATGMSRRKADAIIHAGRVTVDGKTASLGHQVSETDKVALDDKPLTLKQSQTIILNKPVGYVCSRRGQGSKTIYELLEAKLHNLKPVGRLDKDSSGLLVLTNDGRLANELTHPKFAKEKVYQIELDKELSDSDKNKIEQGVELEDGASKLDLSGQGKSWEVKMSEGRNRQIRRTFEALGYKVSKLHRTNFGEYNLDDLESGHYKIV